VHESQKTSRLAARYMSRRELAEISQ